MKTVKSISELKRMALQKGASVNLGSEVFNSSNVRAQLVKPAAVPAPEPAAKPPPAPTVDPMEKLGVMLAHAIASMPQPAAPVTNWLFTVERDENGLLTTIRATAQE